MNIRILASCLALILLASHASAASRTHSPVVRDHRTSPVVRDHRSGVRDHQTGAPGGGVKVTNTPGAKRRPACANNVCRDVTR
jgi:hypothetical protein